MPFKENRSNRERKKDKKKDKKKYNVYSKKHIRIKESLLNKTK
tara:strand:+ start:781 stop:909 length:129 start_codon:yes stop_codon:yes gene_type:complete